MVLESYKDLQKAIESGFDNASILVVGDLILDVYHFGAVHRISPEGPVPVVHLKDEKYTCGGAANVAVNLANLGLAVTLAGWIGDDPEGSKLLKLLGESGVTASGVVVAQRWNTISKTRILSNNQLMMRLDREEPVCSSKDEVSQLYTNIENCIIKQSPAAVILSDYAKGVLTEELCQKIIFLAKERSIPVLVDPKGKNYSKYAGATLLSPNRVEMAEAVGGDVTDINVLLDSAKIYRQNLGVQHLVVTLSERGLAHLSETGNAMYPATAKDVYDVSGAGDTVIAAIGAGVAGGLELYQSLQLANMAAGIVVGKVGVYPIQPVDLLNTISSALGREQSEKICEVEELKLRVTAWRNNGKKIVFTNGCFDLLHAGHVTYLENAAKAGDRLIVGLNTDRSVRELKGAERPVIKEQDRARVLAALASVDSVILFDEPTPQRLIEAVLPDVLAKGADYTEDQVVGGDFVKANGGKVALIPLVAGKSSTIIIENCRENGS